MKLPDVQEDHIFLKAFPHSLEGVAKDWLYYLAPRSITSWDDLKRVFLEKNFLASRTTARSDAIVIRGLHEVATNSSSSAETKKLEGKLDALVNLVTQLAMNKKSAPVARLCGLCSSADHHTDLCPSVQQSEAIEQPEAYAANIYNRPPQPQ